LYDTSLTLRQRLKAATTPAHEALEARIGPLTTQMAYNEYVRGLHAFRSTAEDWLSTQDTHAFGAWKPQQISHHLSNDISDLALTPLSVSAIAWAQRGRSFAMGVHYVLEGSALGARVLCKQVEALGLHREHGARHLWAQAETLEGWRGFLDLLARHDGDEDALFAGANAAFNAAAGAMERAADV
jgi:heme oxygenase